MTKPATPNPQPTYRTQRGRSYTPYLWPKSKHDEQTLVQQFLHDCGWRYDTAYMEFWTPEGDPEQQGRIEWTGDFCAMRPRDVPIGADPDPSVLDGARWTRSHYLWVLRYEDVPGWHDQMDRSWRSDLGPLQYTGTTDYVLMPDEDLNMVLARREVLERLVAATS